MPNQDDFENWFAPRLRTLDQPLFTRKQQLRLIAMGLLLIAVICGIAWWRLK
jgi:hypothetical protein